LIYPEGVACAQVLEAGQEGGRSLGRILIAVIVWSLVYTRRRQVR